MADRELVIEGTILKITNDILDLCDEELCEIRQNVDMPREEQKEKLARAKAMKDIAEFILSQDYAGRNMS